MPIRYAVALYGAVWLFLTLDARLHGRSTPRPAPDACAASGRGGGPVGHAASVAAVATVAAVAAVAAVDCASGRR